MRNIKYIIIHCTATKEGVDIGAKEIDNLHRKKGWSMIGYHYVVRLDGRVEVGRPENKQGAHVKGYNKKSIGVVYIGGVDKNNIPKDTRTEKQKEGLKCLIDNLKHQHPKAKILGHRDFSKDLNNDGVISPFEWMKVCPCFDVKKEYK